MRFLCLNEFYTTPSIPYPPTIQLSNPSLLKTLHPKESHNWLHHITPWNQHIKPPSIPSGIYSRRSSALSSRILTFLFFIVSREGVDGVEVKIERLNKHHAKSLDQLQNYPHHPSPHKQQLNKELRRRKHALTRT